MKRFQVYLLLTLTVVMAADAESLWNQSRSAKNMFADNTATQVGDIVTVVIQESATVSATKSSSTNKSSNNTDLISKVFDTASSLNALGSIDKFVPSSDWSNESTFTGGGSMTDQQTAQSQLSVLVIDRLPNGNLLIEGMRQVSMANEINYAVLRGYIRPSDVRSDNTILSSRIADAQVDFIAEGSLTEAQRQGWLNRMRSYINPF